MFRRFALLAFTLTAGCLGAFGLDGSGDGGGPTGPGGTNPSDGGASAGDEDSGAPAVDPVAEFKLKVAPILGGADGRSGSCGACHGIAGGVGPAFLLPNPDMLTTLLAFPGLVAATPDLSQLYTKGTHEGPPLAGADAPVVAQWIVDWNLYGPKPDGGVAAPSVPAFVPTMGANSVDLSPLAKGITGAKLTFTASLIGTTNPSLELSQITLATGTASGVHVAHPLFVIWDAQNLPTPDPADSFSNLDETVPAASSEALGPGIVVLPSYGTGLKINVAFALIESKAGANGDGGSVFGCKSVTSFDTNAKPTFNNTCATCHGNANNSAATAFSLVGINSAANDATVCANARGEIDPVTPANSRIYTYTDPNSGITHPFKFQAKSNFADLWIAAEK